MDIHFNSNKVFDKANRLGLPIYLLQIYQCDVILMFPFQNLCSIKPRKIVK